MRREGRRNLNETVLSPNYPGSYREKRSIKAIKMKLGLTVREILLCAREVRQAGGKNPH